MPPFLRLGLFAPTSLSLILSQSSVDRRQVRPGISSRILSDLSIRVFCNA